MFQGPRILPELYSREDNDDDLEEELEDDTSGKKKKKKTITAKDLVMNAAHKFSEQRKELQERVIQEVMEAALPDMNDFNMDDFVIGKMTNPPPNKCIRCLQFFGCMTVSIHQAVENGSYEQLEKTLNKLAILLEKEKIEKDYIDEINVTLPPSPSSSFSSLLTNTLSLCAQDKGHTALAEAVRIQRLDMVSLLLSCQANPNIVDEDSGMTPLLYSISNSSYRITNELLKYNADPNITNFNGVTGLMISASLGDINTCRLLVKFNANIDFVDHNGWTALHYSALKDNLDVCDFLLCEGIDKDMKDNKRRKAIHIAKHLGNGMVVALLESFKRRIITKSLPYGDDFITQRRLNEIKAADERQRSAAT